MVCAKHIYTNGKVYTVDGAFSVAEALSVRDGRFLAVGTAKEVLEDKCAETQVHDLEGRTVLPGLIDSHAHLLSLGLKGMRLELEGIETPEEVAALVAKEAERLDDGEWILGRGWDQTLWPSREFPDRKLLDGAAPANPVFLKRVDGHAAWANSRTLEAASVGRDTPDPAGGKILRRKDGEPAGVLVDNAAEMVESVIPEPSRQERKRAIEMAVYKCLSTGLTMVHDAGIDAETLSIYRELIAQGEFPFRVYAMVMWDAEGRDEMLGRGPVVAFEDRLWLKAVKLFADGALGSRGAALLEPYSDDPANSGLLVMKEDELREAVHAVVEKGFQPGIHAIGDRGNRIVIDIYEEVLAKHSGEDLRLRVEHAQVLAPADIARIGKLGIVASMQPTHCTSDMRWAEKRLGPERAAGAYAWRKVMDSGALVASGSDFPVESHNPFFGLHAAVTRQDKEGFPEGGWRSGERMTLEEALRSFTIAGAKASFTEKDLGSIEPGKHADFVVLADDVFSMPPEKIYATGVVMTVVGGVEVFSR